MAPLTLHLKRKTAKSRKITVSIDADRLEKLASLFGLYNPEFLASLRRSEKDEKSGRMRRITSFSEILP